MLFNVGFVCDSTRVKIHEASQRYSTAVCRSAFFRGGMRWQQLNYNTIILFAIYIFFFIKIFIYLTYKYIKDVNKLRYKKYIYACKPNLLLRYNHVFICIHVSVYIMLLRDRFGHIRCNILFSHIILYSYYSIDTQFKFD